MKGQILDLIMIMVMLVGFAITILFAYMLTNEFITNPTVNSTLNATYFQQAQTGLKVFNYGFLFLTVGLIVAVVVGAFYIDTHPIFFVFSLILLGIAIMIGGILTNVYVEIAQTDLLLPIANQFNIMTEVIIHYPHFALFGGILVIIALYAKWKRGEGNV